MDADDVYDWLLWGFLLLCFSLMLLVLLGLTIIAIAEIIYSRRRRRRRKSVDQLLVTISEVPYKNKSAAADEEGSKEVEECVICQAAYEVDDTCLVLPRCKHMFHKPCIVTWLRKQVTCPLCRTSVIPASLNKLSKQRNDANNMV